MLEDGNTGGICIVLFGKKLGKRALTMISCLAEN